ncbi:hypothetical protein H0H92_002370 [Tricholoma furcatifolium]|nr:hypothetical protein H0H92_002370 [Tricholoma furcatifolium]
MTNAKETPEDPTSQAFKDELRAKFADYKRKLRDELAVPPEVPHVSPPWTKDDKKVMHLDSRIATPVSHPWPQQWTMAEKMEWWGKQPQPTPNESSVAPEFQEWLKDVYPEDHDVFFDEREQQALAEAGW